jgi:hypothetical protein
MNAKSSFKAAYTAARAGRCFFEMPFAAEAISVLHDAHKSPLARRHSRWLSSSIPQLTRPGLTAVDVARWLAPARAALYAVAAMRRSA